jgi:hypothetical protein
MPGAGVDDPHGRPGSRSTEVSIPFKEASGLFHGSDRDHLDAVVIENDADLVSRLRTQPFADAAGDDDLMVGGNSYDFHACSQTIVALVIPEAIVSYREQIFNESSRSKPKGRNGKPLGSACAWGR